MSKVTIQFAGGAKSPTGSNFVLTVGDKKFLIDCGLYQGNRLSNEKNVLDFTYDPKSIDALFITHGHLDHVGRIGKLVKDGFSGPIYSTPPTREIGELIMLDSMYLIKKENKKFSLPMLYDEFDVVNAMRSWHVQKYHEVLPIETSEGILSVKFLDSGHIMGSSMIEFSLNGKKLVFTGDLGNTPSPLLPDTEELKNVDYLVMESVYGDRNHEKLEMRVKFLKDTMLKTLSRGGNLLIPAFSIERTQEILYYLNNMVENGEIERVPVYLDSPLGINITKVYRKYSDYLNTGVDKIIKSGDDIFKFPGLVETPTADESKAILKDNRPKIIIAGSGMSNGGRIIHHEKNYLGDPKNTLLLVGYQAVGTMGRLIQEGEKNLKIDGEDVNIKAEVLTIQGFSAHKDSDHLVEFVGSTADTLKKVFVVLGEPKSSSYLAQKLIEYYGLDVSVPDLDNIVTLDM